MEDRLINIVQARELTGFSILKLKKLIYQEKVTVFDKGDGLDYYSRSQIEALVDNLNKGRVKYFELTV